MREKKNMKVVDWEQKIVEERWVLWRESGSGTYCN